MKKANILVPFVLIVGVGGVLLYGTLTTGHNWGDDFAAYIMQARSLTEAAPGAFIEAHRFTIELSSATIGPVVYPWGFPLLLAPIYAVFGLNMIALKAVGVLSYVLFLVLFWFGFRRIHSPSWFLCLVCLFALNPSLLAFSDNIRSELLFLFLSTLALVVIGAVVIERRRFISQLWDSVLIGILVAIAFFVRTNGFLLLISLGFAQFISYFQKELQGWQRNPKNDRHSSSLRTLLSIRSVSVKSLFVQLVPYAVFFCSIMVWELVLPQGGASYVSTMRSLSMNMIKSNMVYYLDLPSEFFSGVPHHYLLYGASLPLAIAGVIRRYRSDYHVIVYVMLTIALHVVLPYTAGIRYLFPILPFYVSFVLSGLEAFQGGRTVVEKQLRNLVCYVPVVLVIFCFAFQSSRSVYDNIRRDREMSFGPFTLNSRSMFSFIAERTEEDSTVIFFKPRLMTLMTNRKSVLINMNNVEEFSRGDYLCVYLLRSDRYNQVSTAVKDLVERGIARLVYENSDFRVYRVSEERRSLHNNALP